MKDHSSTEGKETDPEEGSSAKKSSTEGKRTAKQESSELTFEDIVREAPQDMKDLLLRIPTEVREGIVEDIRMGIFASSSVSISQELMKADYFLQFNDIEPEGAKKAFDSFLDSIRVEIKAKEANIRLAEERAPSVNENNKKLVEQRGRSINGVLLLMLVALGMGSLFLLSGHPDWGGAIIMASILILAPTFLKGDYSKFFTKNNSSE